MTGVAGVEEIKRQHVWLTASPASKAFPESRLRRPTSLALPSALILNSTEYHRHRYLTFLSPYHYYDLIIINKHCHFMTSCDQFPVSIRSAVKSNLTAWCYHSLSNRALNSASINKIAKSSTSFGWGEGWNVTSAGWQVTLCDPIWHVSSSSGVATLVSELLYPCYLLHFTLLQTLRMRAEKMLS